MGNSLNSDYLDVDQNQYAGLSQLEPLKFHEVCSRGVVVGPNRLVLRCLDQGSGMAFSDRPIQPGEIICMKVVMFHKGVFRFGLTTHDPSKLTPEILSVFLSRASKSIFIKEVSSGTTQKNTFIFFKLTHDGKVVYGWQRKDKDKDKGVLISEVPVHIPVWAIFDISGRNLALRLEGNTLHVLRTKSFRRKERMKRTKSLELITPMDNNSSDNVDSDAHSTIQEQRTTNISRARSSSISGLSNRNLTNQSESPNIDAIQNVRSPEINDSSSRIRKQEGRRFSRPQTKPALEERIPMYFHLKVGKNISLSAERTVATNRTGLCNGYVFTRRPLWTEEKLVIGILKVGSQTGANLGFGLTVCDPKVVTEFPDNADEFLDREEYWVFVKDVCSHLKEGDELAFIIKKNGEVGLSKNQSAFRTLMHVDPLMMFWAFFDITGPLEKIASLGTVLHRRQSVGSAIDPTSDIPWPETPRLALFPQPTLPPRPNNSVERLNTDVSQSAVTSPRESRVITPPVRNQSCHFDVFADLPLLLTPPLIPVPSVESKPQIPQRRNIPPRENKKASLAPQPPTQNFPDAKILSNKEIESLLRVTDASKSLPYARTSSGSHECSVCLENVPDCVLYTCGHMCLCYDCGQNILKSNSPLCPLCRKTIVDVIKIYKS